MNAPKVFVLFAIIFSWTGLAQGLRCYFCSATGGNNQCEDFNTYKTAMAAEGNPEVKKNCTAPFDEACIIESYAVLGNTVSHIRDCSDNNWFSFNSSISNDRGAYDRLFQLTLNNETACVWDGQHLVCLSKCDTDFCNGPVLKEKQVVNSGNFSNIGNFNQRSLLVLASIVYTYLYSRSTVIV